MRLTCSGEPRQAKRAKRSKQVSKADMGLWELRIRNLLYRFAHGGYTTASELHSRCFWQHEF
jgi:hypothetical protein